MRRLCTLIVLIGLYAGASPSRAPAQSGQALSARAAIPSPPRSPNLPAVPSVAPGYQAPHVRPGAPSVVGVTAQPFVGISLSDVVGMALLRNPDLAVAAGNRRIAFYGIQVARGAFDVRLRVQPEVDHSILPPENPFSAGPNFGPIAQNDQSLSGGVSGVLPNGQQYSVNVTQTRVDNNSITSIFSPNYPTALSFSLTQPLLRNAGMNEQKRELQLAVVSASQSTEQTLALVSTTIEQVEDTYWDLVAAWRNVAIQEEALREAIVQQRSTIRLARHGAGAPVDAVESGAQVAAFKDDVYSALQDVALLQNRLKSEIADNPADPIWEANLVPTSPVLRIPPVPAFAQLVAQAMQNRPEIRQSLDAELQADVNLAYARNQVLPQIDLKLGYTSNGFAGQLVPIMPSNPLYPFIGTLTPPSYLVGGLGQSYANAFNARFPYYSAAVVFSTPLGDHTARAQLAQARVQERDAEVQLYGVEQRIGFEARNALQAYRSALSRLAAARAAREASEVVYGSELRKFRNGTSTTFLVLQRQVELAQNRGRELQAQTDLNKAVVELQRVSGNILNANGVNLETLGSRARQ